jgi:hypothetical protein
LVRLLVPATAKIPLAKAGLGVELARQNAHGQRPAHNHADVLFLAVGQNVIFRHPVQDAVINLQGSTAAVGVERLQVIKVAGADAIGPHFAVPLQALEAFHEDFHGWLAEVDVALDQVNVVGLQAAQVALHAGDQLLDGM